MTDVVNRGRLEDVREGDGCLSVVDVDVHEMLTSIRDLIPYLEEPWRSRVAVNDGYKDLRATRTPFRRRPASPSRMR